MVRPFHYAPAAQRVAFGAGNLAEVAVEAGRFGRAFVVATSDRDGLASRVAALVDAAESARFFRAAPHTPVAVTEQALAALEGTGAACLVSVGGGSATGLAKALAYRCGLPIVAVPTTYAGSELTPILGQTDEARKWTLRDEAVRPRVVVYDVALTHDLPARLSAASGCNALAHAVEALWARDASAVHLLFAEEAVRVLAVALPGIVEDPRRTEARADALYGAFLAGTCLGACEMALHHRICHVLGGRFGLPHAETRTRSSCPTSSPSTAPASPPTAWRGCSARGRGRWATPCSRSPAGSGCPGGSGSWGSRRAASGRRPPSFSRPAATARWSSAFPLTEALGRAARGEPPRGLTPRPDATRLS